MSQKETDKPVLLKAVESILGDKEHIRSKALDTVEYIKSKAKRPLSEEQLQAAAAKQIVRRYSNMTALAGGATALVSIVPGLGTVVAMTGGALSDAALCMKFQVEMIWEIATVYGRDVNEQAESDLCMLLAGLGALNEVAKQGGIRVAGAALANMSKPYLRELLISVTKVVFRRLGVTVARRALAKAVPFGIGVGVSALANKAMTSFIGREGHRFFVEAQKIRPRPARTTRYRSDGNDNIIDAEYKVV